MHRGTWVFTTMPAVLDIPCRRTVNLSVAAMRPQKLKKYVTGETDAEGGAVKIPGGIYQSSRARLRCRRFRGRILATQVRFQRTALGAWECYFSNTALRESDFSCQWTRYKRRAGRRTSRGGGHRGGHSGSPECPSRSRACENPGSPKSHPRPGVFRTVPKQGSYLPASPHRQLPETWLLSQVASVSWNAYPCSIS